MPDPVGYAHAATLAATPDLTASLAAQLREANAAIQRVRALHVPDQILTDVAFCNECGTPWPCRTVRALDVSPTRPAPAPPASSP